MQSIRDQHPEVDRFIILSDALHQFPDVDLAAHIIACDDLGIELLENMKLWYSIVEFNTAIKPFIISYLFEQRGLARVVYLDPDIVVYSRLDEVFHALRRYSLVLTPHMMKPLQDGKEPSDLTIMKSGVYNLGFVALRNDSDARKLVHWWCQRLFAHCRIDIAGNMFTDQRWMDLAPALVQRPYILRHPGYNVAYWNIAHRVVEQCGDGSWTADGEPLRFFHFSGIKPDDPEVFSKHQNRFTAANLGVINELCATYRKAVLSNRWADYSRIEYAYGRFRDGRTVSDTMRRWILRAVDDGRLSADERLEIGADYFDAADDEVFYGGGRLTRFAYQFWRDREDLQHAFDLYQAEGLNGYLDWFCGSGAEAEGVDPISLQAARDLRRSSQAGTASLRPPPVRVPWATVSSSAWDGPASAVEAWIREDVVFGVGPHRAMLPKQVALLWERRADLQQSFPIRNDPQHVDALLTWALTDGLREGTVGAEFFSDRIVDSLTATSNISLYYDDVPITRALILTRHLDRYRNGFFSWRAFPAEKTARIEHGFWFSYVAPAAFGWPAAWYAPVKAWFDRPTPLSVDGFRFSRGMLTLWEMRGDLQRTFHLDTELSKWRFLCWLARHAPGEFNTPIASLCPGLPEFLAGKSSRYPDVSRLLELVYDDRQDLQRAFAIDTAEGSAAFWDWASRHLEDHLTDHALTYLVYRPVANPDPQMNGTVRAHVALTGHWDAASGLGEDLRSTVAALDACGFCDYVIVNIDGSEVLNAAKCPLPGGTRVVVAWNIVHRNAETSAEDWLTLRRMGVTARRVVGHWHWELERIPSKWRHCYSFYDEIWASSRFAHDAFALDDCRPVKLVPGAVTAPTVNTVVSRVRLGLSETATLYLFMFDFASYAVRKNPGAVIRAFLLAFPRGDENVQLMIKTQNALNAPDAWASLTALGHDPRIIVRDTRLSREELVSLMTTADAFVSLHRSEGYGRGPAEAMLLGRPVILTGYSGTNDFADPSCACLVDFHLVPVQPDEYPGVESQRWAEADVTDAARHMRWIHENPAAARELGERGRVKVATLLSPNKVGQELLRLLEVDKGGNPAGERRVAEVG